MRRGRLASCAAALLFVASAAPRAEAAALVQPGEVLRGDFVQERTLEGFDAPLRSAGSFVLAPGRGLIWRTTEPFPVVTVITRDGLLQTNEDAILSRLSAARTPLFGRIYGMLDSALRGDWQPFETLYHVTRSERGKRWKVELTPREETADAMPFARAVIGGARFVEKVDITRSGGSADSLRFRNQTLSDGPVTLEESTLLERVEE